VQFVNPTSSPTIDQAQSINVTVSTSDASSVTWSLQAGFGKPKGKLSNQTATSATYTAPATVSQETQVTIVAASGKAAAALAVFIMPPPQQPVWSSGAATSCPPNGTVILPNSSPPATQVGRAVVSGTNLKVTGGVIPYTWSLASGSLPDGLSLQVGADTSQPQILGTPITSGCSSFTLQVTDAVGVSATSGTLYMIVLPPSLKVNAPSLRDALIDPSNNGVSYDPAMMLASGGTPPYTWSVLDTSGLPNDAVTVPPGLSVTSNGLISGVPSPDGLAGNGHPGVGQYNPTLQVSDQQLPYPAAAQLQRAINVDAQNPSCPTGQEGRLKAQGSYAFQLHGFDAAGPVTISGNFAVDGTGNVTGGTEDISRTTGAQTGLQIQPGNAISGTGSTYSLRGSRGCVTLATSAGTTPFRIAMGGCSTGRDAQGRDCQPAANGGAFYLSSGHMVESDDSTGTGTRVSGIVRFQDPSTFQDSGIHGMYAFGLSGWDASKARFAMAGSATANSGSWTSVAADTNDAGTLGTATGGSGTFNVGADGRGTGTITVGSLSLNVVLYPVSSSEVLIATVGPPTAVNPMLSGEAIGIATTPGAFTSHSLENSHIFHVGGAAAQGPDPSIGIITFDGIGGFTAVQYEDQAGTLSTSNLSGGYSMDGSSGRFAFSATGTQNVGLHPLVGYVIPAPSSLSYPACIVRAACITGFLLSTDATAQAGVLEFQTPPIGPPPPFSVNNLLGDYVLGTDEPLDSKTAQVSGYGSAGPPVISLTLDSSYGDPKYCLLSSCVLLVPGDQASNTNVVVNADGSGIFGGQTVAVTNTATTFYIDESPLNLHPSIVVVEQ